MILWLGNDRLVAWRRAVTLLTIVAVAAVFAAPQAGEHGWRVALVAQSPGIAPGFVGDVFSER